MIECMLFLLDQNSLKHKAGLGVHPFGRIPVTGEYISLASNEIVYKVTHVHHTGFGTHKAELYVVETDDIQMIGGEPLPLP